MIRVLFSVLVVVIMVLAIVLEPYRAMLFAAAAVLLLIVVLLWVGALRQRHRASTPVYPARPPMSSLPKDDLKSLGILDIRPKESPARPSNDTHASPPATPKVFPEPAAIPVAEEIALAEEPDQQPIELPGVLQEFVIQSPEPTSQETIVTNDLLEEQTGRAVLVPYLQSLRAALKAHTVCLLEEKEQENEYRVLTLLSEDGVIGPVHAFATETPLLNATQIRQSVTVKAVGEADLAPGNLGYSADAAAVCRVALAPVPCAAPSSYLLLADTLQDDFSSPAAVYTLLPRFAALLGALLDTLMPTSSDGTTVQEPIPTVVQAEKPVRPRREIIAEEMALARSHHQVLALALVYLNQAEALADEGQAVVSEAELLLETTLREATTYGRVERFGELTYGVFYDGSLPEVEAWGAQIQHMLSEADGLLAGGVSIGIAMLQDRHQTPDAFRSDATEALREAYATGTCTILE